MIDFHALCENILLCGFCAVENIHNNRRHKSNFITFREKKMDAPALTNVNFFNNSRAENFTTFIYAVK